MVATIQSFLAGFNQILQTRLMCIGDRKGMVLTDTISRVQPQRVLELGCFLGYSAIRMAAALSSEGEVRVDAEGWVSDHSLVSGNDT